MWVARRIWANLAQDLGGHQTLPLSNIVLSARAMGNLLATADGLWSTCHVLVYIEPARKDEDKSPEIWTREFPSNLQLPGPVTLESNMGLRGTEQNGALLIG